MVRIFFPRGQQSARDGSGKGRPCGRGEPLTVPAIPLSPTGRSWFRTNAALTQHSLERSQGCSVYGAVREEARGFGHRSEVRGRKPGDCLTPLAAQVRTGRLG